MGLLRAQRLRVQVRQQRDRLAAEHGVTLVETLISAVILVIVLLAVMSTIDVSSRTAAANRTRTVAASLAEQDQERLRALSAPSLSNYHQTKTDVVDGNQYTVESDTDWIYDATGATESCLNKTTQANYIRISSTVTSAIVGKRIKPVTMKSLVAPRVGDFGANQGTLAVLVKNQAGDPVPNMPVTITGPAALTDATNDFGCAVFGHIPIGDYEAILNQSGWVDKNREQYSTQPATVTDGNTAAISMTYALASAIEVRFETKVGTGGLQAARGNAITVSNSSVPAKGIDPAGSITFLSPTAPVSSLMIPALGLFPFPDGYTAYAGDCAANDPTQYNANYYATFPGFTLVTPGTTTPVTVREPSFNIHVRQRNLAGAVTDYGDANVVIKLTSPGCNAATSTFAFRTIDNPPSKRGMLQEPGLPFGTYSACVDDSRQQPIPALRRKQEITDVVNTNPAGLPILGDGTPANKLTLSYELATLSPLGQC